MTTVTGAPSASPYPKGVNESGPTRSITDECDDLSSALNRCESLLYALDDALEEIGGNGAAGGRALDFLALARDAIAASHGVTERIHNLAVEARDA